MNPVDHDPSTASGAHRMAAELVDELEMEKAARFKTVLWIAVGAVVLPLLPFAFLIGKIAAVIVGFAIVVYALMLFSSGAVMRAIAALLLCIAAALWLMGGAQFFLGKLHDRGINLPWPVFSEQMTKPSEERKIQILDHPPG
jgi:uncharacterized membrane protein